ncbi:hypothetical protein B1207_05410 [Legionella quinlivanii]|uniref:Uncharacterized protein n=1 Tax=Legionella quinlivanii TaxID=45073 RepID=A0A364LLI6_9GAMM|nr:hypothetical protein [Legionella quinlivanii]RAP37609.1 hypothetical protein B1207_05410 [Legionella quinlivanii]
MISSFFRPIPVKPLPAEEERLLLEKAIDELPENDALSFYNLVRRLEELCKQEQPEAMRNKLASLLARLGEKARTADLYYILADLQKGYPFLGKGDGQYLQIAAELGHPLALRQVAGYALLGYYANPSQAVSWAIHCLKFMVMLPVHELKTPFVATCLIEDVTRTLERHNWDPDRLRALNKLQLNELIVQFSEHLIGKLANEKSQFTLTQPASALFYSGSFVKYEHVPPPLEVIGNAEEHESDMDIEDESDMHKTKLGM